MIVLLIAISIVAFCFWRQPLVSLACGVLTYMWYQLKSEFNQ